LFGDGGLGNVFGVDWQLAHVSGSRWQLIEILSALV